MSTSCESEKEGCNNNDIVYKPTLYEYLLEHKSLFVLTLSYLNLSSLSKLDSSNTYGKLRNQFLHLINNITANPYLINSSFISSKYHKNNELIWWLIKRKDSTINDCEVVFASDPKNIWFTVSGSTPVEKIVFNNADLRQRRFVYMNEDIKTSNHFQIDDAQITMMANNCGSHLKEIYLANCNNITNEDIESIINACPNLITVSIFKCHNILTEFKYHECLAKKNKYELKYPLIDFYFKRERNCESDDGNDGNELSNWINSLVTGELKDVPGVKQKIKRIMLQNGVSNTWQLIGKFLSFKGPEVSIVDNCEKFLQWLTEIGVSQGHRTRIVYALMEKLNVMFDIGYVADLDVY